MDERTGPSRKLLFLVVNTFAAEILLRSVNLPLIGLFSMLLESAHGSQQSIRLRLAEMRRNDFRIEMDREGIMQVRLYDRLTQKLVVAEITTMTRCHVQIVNLGWIQAFQLRHRSRDRDEDFLMWNMGKGYLDLLIRRAAMRSFVLIAQENVQGVLLLQCELQLSRLKPRLPLVYVHYLATAPWNRRDQKGPGRLRGVGTLLMECALQESRDVGCNGRLGLHSLRGSDDFYLKLGFCNLGIDAARRGMNYFELNCSTSTCGHSRDDKPRLQL